MKKSKKAPTNRDELERLMTEHELTSVDVAAIMGYVPETIRAWRSGRYPTPDIAIRLLKLHIAQAAS